MAKAEKRHLPGYERDINNLIDAYAILAHLQQGLSFQTFKQLFKNGCFAYLHQAYWGCEHSPEYAQLLFAVALDRLDIPSPTAPPDSWLWQLHQLAPGGPLEDTMLVPTAGGGQGDMQQQQQQQHSAAAGAGHAAAPVEMDELLPLHAESLQRPILPPAAAAAVAEPSAMDLDQPGTQDAALLQQPLQPGTLEGHGQHDGITSALLQAQQQQHQHLKQHSPGQRLHMQQQQQQPQPAHQQQQQQPLEQPLEDWMASPLLLPQEVPQQEQRVPGLSPSDAVWQLMTPLMSPLQSHDTGTGAQSGFEGLESFLLPAAAIPPAGQQQPELQQAPGGLHQLQQQQQPELQQAPGGLQQQQQQQQQQQPELQQAPGGLQQLQQHAGGAGAPHQQGGQQQLLLAQTPDDEDDFLSDLLAILDEATQGPGQQYTAGLPAAACSACPEPVAAAGTAASVQRPHHHHQQQQQPLLQIPLVVKGAAVFMLLALHESQLNYPKVPVYVPLPLLQQLATAAAEFSAAGAAAADALHAMHMLVQQQRLLVGQFRRPSHWEPQLPAHLMPGGRLPGGLGADTAIGAAARKAARKAAMSVVQSAAVAVAGRTARATVAFDPGVHREAVFHIKSALRGLSNFKSLQSLCDEYADARQAVFEPLLGSIQPQSTAAAAGLQQQQQTLPAAAGPAGQAGEQGGALVVKRGGSRRKRQAAAAAGAGAGAAAAAAASGQTVVAEDQPAAQVPGGQQRQAAAGGSVASQATGIKLPELFDTGFASALQGLANSEASRMLLLLDPYYSANKVRKRLAEERRAAQAAEAVAAAEAQGRLERFKRLTMGRAMEGGQQHQDKGGPHAAHRLSRQQQHRPSRSGPAAPTAAAGALALDMRQELHAAGVLTEQELQDGAGLGPSMDVALSGAAQQVLRHAAQQRQAAVQVAEEWLRAQSALVVVEADEDMP